MVDDAIACALALASYQILDSRKGRVRRFGALGGTHR